MGDCRIEASSATAEPLARSPGRAFAAPGADLNDVRVELLESSPSREGPRGGLPRREAARQGRGGALLDPSEFAALPKDDADALSVDANVPGRTIGERLEGHVRCHRIECCARRGGPPNDGTKRMGKHPARVAPRGRRARVGGRWLGMVRCPVCGEELETDEEMDAHDHEIPVAMRHAGPGFPCPICGRSFDAEEHLVEHMAQHAGAEAPGD